MRSFIVFRVSRQAARLGPPEERSPLLMSDRQRQEQGVTLRGVHKQQVYRGLLEQLLDHPYTAGKLARLFRETGLLEEAGGLWVALAGYYRELGDPAGLSISLGNQALILKARGDLDGGMALLQEQERLCRQLGDPQGLAISLANQAVLLAQQERPLQALQMAEQALALASRHGNAALLQQIRPIVERLSRDRPVFPPG